MEADDCGGCFSSVQDTFEGNPQHVYFTFYLFVCHGTGELIPAPNGVWLALIEHLTLGFKSSTLRQSEISLQIFLRKFNFQINNVMNLPKHLSSRYMILLHLQRTFACTLNRLEYQLLEVTK